MHASNGIYSRLKERGYEVFAVNPNADTVLGESCYRSLKDIPGGVDGVVIATNPSASLSVAQECKELGIKRVWFHKNFGSGSYSKEAHELCRANGITALVSCPLWYGKTSDGFHRVLRCDLSSARPGAQGRSDRSPAAGRGRGVPQRTEAEHAHRTWASSWTGCAGRRGGRPCARRCGRADPGQDAAA